MRTMLGRSKPQTPATDSPSTTATIKNLFIPPMLPTWRSFPSSGPFLLAFDGCPPTLSVRESVFFTQSPGDETPPQVLVKGTPEFAAKEKSLGLTCDEALSLVREYAPSENPPPLYWTTIPVILIDEYLFSVGDNKMSIQIRGYVVDPTSRHVNYIETVKSIPFPRGFKRPELIPVVPELLD